MIDHADDKPIHNIIALANSSRGHFSELLSPLLRGFRYILETYSIRSRVDFAAS